MFNPFKKKPTELKYGRDNYVQDYKYYGQNDSDRNWLLLLSAFLVEACDIDLGIKSASHDLLSMYPKGALDAYAESELAQKFIYEDITALQNKLMEISAFKLSNLNADVYFAVNMNSLKEAKAKAEERYGWDATYITEVYKTVFNEKKTYQKTHMYAGEIAHTMWQVRLAVYLGMIEEDLAWQILEELNFHISPIMTLFSSWEAYNKNLKQFYVLHELWENETYVSFLEETEFCLRVREESPFNFVPVHFGIDKKYTYNLKTHTNVFPKRLDSQETELLTMIEQLLNKDEKTLLWKELATLNAKEHEEAFKFIVSKSDKTNFSEKSLKKLPELYPNFYAHAMRARYYYVLAWDARGQDTIDTVGDKDYSIFQQNLKHALSDLFKAHKLAPKEKLIWHHSYEILSLLGGDELEKEKAYFYDLIKREGLDHRGCVYVISRFKQDRWGGSFQESLEWAREVISRTNTGDHLRTIIFDVMIEWNNHLRLIEEDEQQAYNFVMDEHIQEELNPYLKELVENIEEAPYEIASSLLNWYALSQDSTRLRHVARNMQVGKFDLNAMNNEYHDDYTEVLMNFFRSI